MHQFGYLQIIPRHPSESTSSTVHHIDLDVILENFKSHLVQEEFHKVLALVQWAYVDDYMAWFYRVSHPIMTPNASGRPLRPSN